MLLLISLESKCGINTLAMLMHSSQSAAFAQTSKNLRRHLWLQNVKMMIAIGVAIAVRPMLSES